MVILAENASAARPIRTMIGRLLAVGAVVAVLGATHLRSRPATVCPLRVLTGVPCPFCGGTTAAVELGRGDPSTAVKASPLAVTALGVLPLLGMIRTRLRRRPGRVQLALLAIVLSAAELWQLARFGFLP